MEQHSYPGSSQDELDPGAIAAVDAYIEERQADFAGFVKSSSGSDHRRNEEKPLQDVVADHLVRLEAEIDQWEPDAFALCDHPMMPPWHHWHDRPMTVGILRGTRRGRPPNINGHVDVVDLGGPERCSRHRLQTFGERASAQSLRSAIV